MYMLLINFPRVLWICIFRCILETLILFIYKDDIKFFRKNKKMNSLVATLL